jgi:hypothetical protein
MHLNLLAHYSGGRHENKTNLNSKTMAKMRSRSNWLLPVAVFIVTIMFGDKIKTMLNGLMNKTKTA